MNILATPPPPHHLSNPRLSSYSSPPFPSFPELDYPADRLDSASLHARCFCRPQTKSRRRGSSSRRQNVLFPFQLSSPNYALTTRLSTRQKNQIRSYRQTACSAPTPRDLGCRVITGSATVSLHKASWHSFRS